MKKTAIIIGILLSVMANAQPANVCAKFDISASGFMSHFSIALKSYTFRKTLETNEDVDDVIREIFSPEAAIVEGGCRDFTSVTTIGAIRRTEAAKDATDIVEIIKSGMHVFDLVWKRGDSELRSVAVTTDDDIVHDNIGTRLLFFGDMIKQNAYDYGNREKKEGYRVYAGQWVYTHVMAPFMNPNLIETCCIADYVDNIIWRVDRRELQMHEGKDDYGRYWSFHPTLTELAGGIACPDYAVLYEYTLCSKEYYADLDGTRYFIPQAAFSDRFILKATPEGIVYHAPGQNTIF